MTAAAEIAVVVATCDRAGRLERLLGALERQSVGTGRFEVAIVDDCSGDATPSVLAAAEAAGRLKLVHLRQPERAGPATARNRGWRSTSAPLVAFTDDDCEPDPEWLTRILARAAVAPDRVTQGRTVPLPEEEAGIGPYSRTLRVEQLGPHYPTCNIAYPRTLLERLGGFDESYPLPGGEDTDLALRAIEVGAAIDYEPGALVHHAVNQLGPAGKLRLALRWSPTMQAFARHPDLREELIAGVFWKSSHALLMLGLGGSLLAWKSRPAHLLWAPYALEVAQRMRTERAQAWQAPYYPLYDAVEIFATVRGGLAYRVVVV